MSNFILTIGFKWIDFQEFDLNKHTKNSSEGFILEVDIEYPKKIRDLHNNYSLAPDKIDRNLVRLSIENC